MTFWDAVDAFAGGVIRGAAIYQAEADRQGAEEHGRIERLCRELNWTVDGRDGETLILKFNHKELGSRDVRIRHGDDILVELMAMSHAFPKAEQVPEQVLGHLLSDESTQSIAGWTVMVGVEERAIFALRYAALGAGLDAPTLKYLCETMIDDVCRFDLRMKDAGLFN